MSYPPRFLCLILLAVAALVPFGAARATPQFTVLHTFLGDAGNDGALPEAGVVIGSGGVLYGTTIGGGGGSCTADGCGAVYQLVPPAQQGGPWTETVLYGFTGGNDGAYPEDDLSLDPTTGILSGTASVDGQFGQGTVFQLVPANNSWTFGVIYAFGTIASDGKTPLAGLLPGPGGSFFGTTHDGGSGTNGTAFQLSPPQTQGAPWTEKILHNFTAGHDGGLPDFGPLIMNANGALFDTTYTGLPAGAGVVYELTPSGTHWKETVLHSFRSYAGGQGPYAGLVEDANGAFYGVTYGSGAGWGTVFQLTPPAQGATRWTYKVLYKFTGGADGGNPVGGLAIGPGGVLYGTTSEDADGYGTVFQLSPPVSGTRWREKVLYTFTGGSDGAMPMGRLVIDANGVLYGTAFEGGTAGYGVVFSVKP